MMPTTYSEVGLGGTVHGLVEERQDAATAQITAMDRVFGPIAQKPVANALRD